MIWFSKNSKRGQCFRRLFAFLCLFAPIFCILVLLSPGLPEFAPDSWGIVLTSKSRPDVIKLSDLGLSMINMLPDDLAFTIFVPSEKAFEQVLKLRSNSSLMKYKANETMAILSRTLAFSTVPQHLPSEAVPLWKELSLDSVSGFKIYVSKMTDGTLLANNIRSKQVDLREGEFIVHIMDGVIMDAEFEQSFVPDYAE